MSEEIPMFPFLLSSEPFTKAGLRHRYSLVGHYQINLRESEVAKLHKGEIVTFKVRTNVPVFAACDIPSGVKGVKAGIQWLRALSTDDDEQAHSHIVLAGNQAVVTGRNGSTTYYVISETAIRINSLYHSFCTGMDQLQENKELYFAPTFTADELIQSGIWDESDENYCDLCGAIVDLMNIQEQPLVSAAAAFRVKVARDQYMDQICRSINWVLCRMNARREYISSTLRLQKMRRQAELALEVFVELARKYPYLPIYDYNRDSVGFATIFRDHPVKFADARVLVDAAWTQFSARFELNHMKWQQLQSIHSSRESDLTEIVHDNLEKMEYWIESGEMGNSDITALIAGAEQVSCQRKLINSSFEEMEAKCEIMGESTAMSYQEAIYVINDLIGLASRHPIFSDLFSKGN